MSVLSSRASTAPRQRVEPAAQLCVVLSCHHLVCALPIRAVDRLALPDAAEPAPPRAGKSKGVGPGGLPLPEVLRFGEQLCAAWDLGPMLGLPATTGTWVLLRAPLDGGEVSLALRTGPCFSVQGVRPMASFPPGIFQARRAALTDSFAVAKAKGVGAATQAAVGVWIEPARLWEPLELAASSAALRQER
jgi:hypothetical protein